MLSIWKLRELANVERDIKRIKKFSKKPKGTDLVPIATIQPITKVLKKILLAQLYGIVYFYILSMFISLFCLLMEIFIFKQYHKKLFQWLIDSIPYRIINKQTNSFNHE